MDIARPDIGRKKRRRRVAVLSAGIVLLAAISITLLGLKPALPSVDRASVWIGTVKRGKMLCQVWGNGTLVPEDIRSIPTATAGLVKRILVLPGAAVKPKTVLVELSNPELAQDAFKAESQLKAAQADLTNLEVQLVSQKLTQQATVATAKADYTTAKADSDINQQLRKSGLVAAITAKESKAKAGELATLLGIEQQRLKIIGQATKAQLAAQEEKIAQLKGLLELKRQQIEGLKIRAGMTGVLQQLGDATAPLQVGQALTAGALVACVANPTKLKASIQIPQTQAGQIRLNQSAEIDTHNGIIRGHVIRIDPAVQNGTVTVDVSLDGRLPPGARPDLSVDGAIELQQLTNVLYVGRPVNGRADGQLDLFKVIKDGKDAVRTPVEFGSASLNNIEIKHGLQRGDQVILSDMSQWDNQTRIKLN